MRDALLAEEDGLPAEVVGVDVDRVSELLLVANGVLVERPARHHRHVLLLRYSLVRVVYQVRAHPLKAARPGHERHAAIVGLAFRPVAVAREVRASLLNCSVVGHHDHFRAILTGDHEVRWHFRPSYMMRLVAIVSHQRILRERSVHVGRGDRGNGALRSLNQPWKLAVCHFRLRRPVNRWIAWFLQSVNIEASWAVVRVVDRVAREDIHLALLV